LRRKNQKKKSANRPPKLEVVRNRPFASIIRPLNIISNNIFSQLRFLSFVWQYMQVTPVDSKVDAIQPGSFVIFVFECVNIGEETPFTLHTVSRRQKTKGKKKAKKNKVKKV